MKVADNGDQRIHTVDATDHSTKNVNIPAGAIIIALLILSIAASVIVSRRLDHRPRVLALGDSITLGITKPRTTEIGGYPAALATLRPELQIINAGHGMWTADDIRLHLREFMGFDNEPDLVLLQVGTNDLIHQNLSPAEAIEHVGNLVSEIQSISSTPILVSTIAPVAERNEAHVNPALVTEFNRLLYRTGWRNVQIVNAAGGLLITDLCSDGIHPSNDGYRKLATAWSRCIHR